MHVHVIMYGNCSTKCDFLYIVYLSPCHEIDQVHQHSSPNERTFCEEVASKYYESLLSKIRLSPICLVVVQDYVAKLLKHLSPG